MRTVILFSILLSNNTEIIQCIPSLSSEFIKKKTNLSLKILFHI